jgi:hypothetical protein
MLWANRNGFFYVLDRVTRRVPASLPDREAELESRAFDNGVRFATQLHSEYEACSSTRAIRAPPTGSARLSARAPGVLRQRLGKHPPHFWPAPIRPTSKAPRTRRAGSARTIRDGHCGRHARAAAAQSQDGRGELRHRPGLRSTNGHVEMGIQDERPHRRRDSDDGIGRAVHRWSRRLLFRAGTPETARYSGRFSWAVRRRMVR